MSRRAEPVVNFTDRPEPGPVRRIMDVLQALLGKVESLVDVTLLHEAAGYTVTNAAGGAGTSLAFSQLSMHFADAGVDNVRVLVRGNNSGGGSVTVTVHDVTNNVELARVTVTGATPATYAGDWTAIRPTGSEQVIEVRVIGNAADDPVLFNVHLQGRTVQARA